MKICAECGRELDKSVETCSCVAEIDRPIIPNAVLKMIQQIVKTKLYLFLAIVFTFAVILGFTVDWIVWAEDLINLFEKDTGNYFLGVVTNIFSHIGINGGNSMLIVDAMFSEGVVLGAIPSALLAIGMWVVYFTVNDCINYEINPCGFKMAEAALLIFAIFTCFNMLANIGVIGMSFIVLITGIFEGNFALFKEMAWGIWFGGIVLFVSLLCQVAVAAFYSNVYGLINSMRTSVAKRTVSTVCPIWGMVALCFGAVSIILNIVSSFILDIYPSGMLIPNIVSACATILFGFFWLSVRHKINDFVEKQMSV